MRSIIASAKPMVMMNPPTEDRRLSQVQLSIDGYV
jgi:hypothetical protein